ncbi:MAG: methyltransferase domain-containing protein [Liquorilactobacillus nagelii]|jgi:ubiquinone/menaquinone biosynthesis C-methylase UbiE|uniref:class I SAM-dependent methyltransferase n=1 Tax=Liquorilactobacillus nagelii TaxID=82688 RepID=UPI002430B595|nr:methyltransferase domain-containing protein [Liquorilactobacillus nagelii]MCI1922095.1 methyltransferase domain-containing protein [Liquorilactobacillus nagelii]MCI1977146.1 methyltransferase domain-containing protein [Liquorilactobacillus nagelii]
MKKSVDAPLVPLAFILFGLLGLVSAIKVGEWTNFIFPMLFLLLAAVYLHTSLIGKYRIIKKVVAGLNIEKNAQILDLGTGHGAFLIEIARHLQHPGKIIGIDIWNKQDQANNSFENTKKLIVEQQLADVSELLTADMVKLPFKGNNFNYVVASLSIHNLKPAYKRQAAIQEAFRVLKKGGRMVIIDIEHVGEYQKFLQQLGAKEISISNTGINGMYAGLFTKVLIAKK